MIWFANFTKATLTFLCIFMISGLAIGENLGQPQGPIILTISGSISNTNGDGVARFDKEMLAAIGTSVIITSTTWTDGKEKFTGVLGRDLLKAVGASGNKIRAVAINDYKITIPVSDFYDHDVILATSMNGKVLTRRDKGPIWIVYPKDGHPELRNETTDGKSIWQLVKIVVE